jgi:hypothetical protein
MQQIPRLARDQRLLERLRALRHLPPNTSLPQITAKTDQRLLRDLLRLPKDMDVLVWLHTKAKRRASTIALRLALQEISHSCYSLAKSSREEISEYHHQLLGGLLNLPEADLPFHQLKMVEEYDNTEELLRNLFHQTQLLRRRDTTLSPSFQMNHERDQFFVDLMNLPLGSDPLWWLENARAVFMRQFVLSHLLNRFCRSASLAGQPELRTISVNKSFRPSPFVTITIEHVTVKEAGLLVKAELTFFPKKLSHNPPYPHPATVYSWEGFERAVDSVGYHYLTSWQQMSSGTASPHSCKEQLIMTCYPALAEGSTEITFSSQPMMIEADTAYELGGPRIRLPDIVAGDLLWRLALV